MGTYHEKLITKLINSKNKLFNSTRSSRKEYGMLYNADERPVLSSYRNIFHPMTE